jgi:hypothetical protein
MVDEKGGAEVNELCTDCYSIVKQKIEVSKK